MPQATATLRKTMDRYFGDGISDAGPIAFLKRQGYTLSEGWEWLKPTPTHKPTVKEMLCIMFLIEEWDFGGIAVGNIGETP